MTWKIVGTSKALVLYIYIYIDYPCWQNFTKNFMIIGKHF